MLTGLNFSDGVRSGDKISASSKNDMPDKRRVLGPNHTCIFSIVRFRIWTRVDFRNRKQQKITKLLVD